MKTHIYEFNGVLLSVRYTPELVPTIHSVHVLDTKYRCVGPDLVPLLVDTLVLVGRNEAEGFLSQVAEELK